MSTSLRLETVEALRSFKSPSGGNLWAELSQLFVTQLIEHREKMTVALEKNDFLELQRLAHLLKSSSGNLGAFKLSNLCEETEFYLRQSKQPDGNHLQSLVTAIVGESFSVEKEMKTYEQR